MEIQVNKKNEYDFYPDIQNNLELPEKERFTIVVRKLSETLHSIEWMDIKKDGKSFKANIGKKLKTHIVRLENAPDLRLPTGELKRLDVDILVSGEYEELFDLVDMIFDFIKDIEGNTVIETKKS